MDEYISVCGRLATEKVIEKSRFITHSAHVEGEEQARAFIAEISEKFSDATHNCYAYIADRGVSLFRFSDDGEPSGTAGMPMLEVLKNRKLAYTAVVVTRYFGGIKLGAGGLVRAYSGCVAEHLNTADIKRYTLCRQMRYLCDYSNADAASRYIAKYGANLLGCDYFDGVTYTVSIEDSKEAEFTKGLINALCGKVEWEKGESYFAPVD